jgi:hypothetical protein
MVLEWSKNPFRSLLFKFNFILPSSVGLGQNSWQPFCKHRLSRAGRAYHDNVIGKSSLITKGGVISDPIWVQEIITGPLLPQLHTLKALSD